MTAEQLWGNRESLMDAGLRQALIEWAKEEICLVDGLIYHANSFPQSAMNNRLRRRQKSLQDALKTLERIPSGLWFMVEVIEGFATEIREDFHPC